MLRLDNVGRRPAISTAAASIVHSEMAVCFAADAWMIHDSAMERLLFDGVPHWHPAQFAGMP
ncbi:MAG TPA: hypothetical protein VLE94_09025, partial [Burkholderiaceae bacterium]|nr:hypothetical protein [Burkholderiaceae bacterium]